VPRPRAYFAITGSELVRGERTDRNGPWLAEQALTLGLEPTRIAIVGDDPDELRATLREGLGADLLVTSGGLGPTHDDRTVELVAEAVGEPLRLDDALREQIDGISRSVAARLRRPCAVKRSDAAQSKNRTPSWLTSLPPSRWQPCRGRPHPGRA